MSDEFTAARMALLRLRRRVEKVYTNYVGQEGRGGASMVRDEVLRMLDAELASLDRIEALGQSLVSLRRIGRIVDTGENIHGDYGPNDPDDEPEPTYERDALRRALDECREHHAATVAGMDPHTGPTQP